MTDASTGKRERPGVVVDHVLVAVIGAPPAVNGAAAVVVVIAVAPVVVSSSSVRTDMEPRRDRGGCGVVRCGPLVVITSPATGIGDVSVDADGDVRERR